MTPDVVAVVGASGLLGREVARHLLSRGYRVVAVTRDGSRVADLASSGADVRVADLTDAASLAAACRGVQVVVAAAHGILGRGRYRSEIVDDLGHRALIDAAKAEGVRHVVYTSVLGASPDHVVDFWRTKHAVEEHLKASGLSWTILRPAAFMEMHAHELIGKSILAGRTATILGPGDRPMNFVAVRDVAHLAVLAATDPALSGRTVRIGGPEVLTQDEVAALYGRLCGRTPRVRHVPAGALRFLAAAIRPLHPGIARVMHAGAAGGMLDETVDPDDLQRRYAMRLTRLEEVARERMAATPVGA